MDILVGLITSNKQDVLDLYRKSGLTDPDAICDKKNELLLPHALTKKVLKIFMWFSSPLVIFFIFSGALLPFAVLFVLMFFFGFRLVNKKIALIESATLEYCKEIGVAPVEKSSDVVRSGLMSIAKKL